MDPKNQSSPAQSTAQTDPIATKVVGKFKETSEKARYHAFRIKNSQIVIAIMGGIGGVFFVFGTERLVERIPIISEPIIEITVGILLLSASGLLIKKLGGGE